MTTVEEAKTILLQNTIRINNTVVKKVENSAGYFLAEDIYSAIDLPPFDQSNVDGYAINSLDLNKWKVVSEIKAGSKSSVKLKRGESSRIFTGGAAPDGTDCIIMQENIAVEGNWITTKNNRLIRNEFVRKKGSQINSGDKAVSKDVLITPALVGFLSAMGIKKIKVFKKPVIVILITGNELEVPGKRLSPGKVYDSNSFILKSALRQMNLKAKKIVFLKDKKRKIQNAVSGFLNKADVILITGGVSVGKYDYVDTVLNELGTKKLFHNISQRPGKPLYFGKNKSIYIFGLPGNPASVLTCFYEYVFPHLRKLQGYADYFLEQKYLPVTQDIQKNFKLGNFLKAKIRDNMVEPLEGQASYILKSFAEANCFIYLKPEVSFVKAGEEVEVHMFPNS